jgi:hypothetical protein
VQASGWREQKPRKSPTVADAAEIASVALTSLVEALRCAAPIGNSTSTRPSQNIIRKRKNIKPTSPAASIAACGPTVAGRVEDRVGGTGTFLRIIEQNNRQIFAQVEKIKFT